MAWWAWWGFVSARDRERLERLVNKLSKERYLNQDLPPLSALVAEANSRLFSAIETRADHVLSHLLPHQKENQILPQTPNTRICATIQGHAQFCIMAINIAEGLNF